MEEKEKNKILINWCESYSSPQQIIQSISDLRKQNEILLSKQGEFNSIINTNILNLKNKEDELNELKLQFDNLNNKQDQFIKTIQLKESKIENLLKGNQGLKNLISSYNQEQNSNSNSNFNSNSISNQSLIRISELEKIIKGNEEFIEYLESKIVFPKVENSNISLKYLENENEQLKHQLLILQEKLEINSNSKILHMSLNPESQRIPQSIVCFFFIFNILIF
jgi:hypothetical protein